MDDRTISRTETQRRWNLYASALIPGAYEADFPMHPDDILVTKGIKRTVVTELLGALDEVGTRGQGAVIEVQYQSGGRPITQVTERFQEWDE
jgi:hypothetical protein